MGLIYIHDQEEEGSSIEWETITLTEQEEGLLGGMHKLIGDRWFLIAGRIPGRSPEELERFWVMAHSEEFGGRASEVSSTKWETVTLSEQEEDMLGRMHKLLGDRWVLIAGRIPGRNPEELERFWIMSHIEEQGGKA